MIQIAEAPPESLADMNVGRARRETDQPGLAVDLLGRVGAARVEVADDDRDVLVGGQRLGDGGCLAGPAFVVGEHQLELALALGVGLSDREPGTLRDRVAERGGGAGQRSGEGDLALALASSRNTDEQQQ